MTAVPRLRFRNGATVSLDRVRPSISSTYAAIASMQLGKDGRTSIHNVSMLTELQIKRLQAARSILSVAYDEDAYLEQYFDPLLRQLEALGEMCTRRLDEPEETDE